MARITAYLKAVPGCYVRNIHGSAYTAGMPDLVGCYAGRFFAIECKQRGQKPTALQVTELRKIRQAGGQAVWCDDFEAFLSWWHGAVKDRA